MLTTGYSHCFSGQLIWIFLWFILKMYIYFYEPDFFSFFTNNRQTRKCCNASFIHLHSSTVLSNIGMKKTKSFLVLSKQKFSFWNLLAKHNLMAIIKKKCQICVGTYEPWWFIGQKFIVLSNLLSNIHFYSSQWIK